MLTARRSQTQAKVVARDSLRTEAPFECLGCKQVVTLRKGNIKAHHFAHRPPVTCMRGIGESEQHREVKQAIYDALSCEPTVTELELEHDLGGPVADVYACISGVRVAIEIQRSILSVNDITTRTINYHRLGVAVLWVALPSAPPEGDQYSPSAWEKWVHAVYYGRIYYWETGQMLRPVHFGDYFIDVPTSTWFEGGSQQSAGGYAKRSKRWRSPHIGAPVLISSSFRKTRRTAWAAGSVVVPECTIYQDIQRQWWLQKSGFRTK